MKARRRLGGKRRFENLQTLAAVAVQRGLTSHHLRTRIVNHPGEANRLSTRSAFRVRRFDAQSDPRRTPVVDLESVNRRAGEEVVEPDQPFGCGAGVR